MTHDPDVVMMSLTELVGFSHRLLKKNEYPWYDQLERLCLAYEEQRIDLKISKSTLDDFLSGDFFTTLAIAIEGAHEEIPRLRAELSTLYHVIQRLEAEIKRLKGDA